MNPVKAVIFDLGNVLVSFSHELACRQMAAVAGVSQQVIEGILFGEQLSKAYEAGQYSTTEFHRLIESRIGKPIDQERLMFAASNIFTEIHGVTGALTTLKQQVQKLLLLSNTNDAHFSFIQKAYPFIDLFDDLILSYQVKFLKPAPEIYLHAVEKAGVPASQCLFIDDLMENVAGARACGLQGIQFLNLADLKSQLAGYNLRI